MKKIATLLVLMFSISTGAALACPGEKAKDDGKQSTPPKPTTSLSIY